MSSLRLLLRGGGDTDCDALLRTRAGGDFAGLRAHKTLSGEVVKTCSNCPSLHMDMAEYGFVRCSVLEQLLRSAATKPTSTAILAQSSRN